MFVKRLLTIIIMLAVSTAAASGYAQDNIRLAQAYAWERYIDIFLADLLNPGSLEVQVSQLAAQVADSGLLADRGIPSGTTILVDISSSVSAQSRRNAAAYIDRLIYQLQPESNEQYRIVTFGEQVQILQDFTSDRFDLSRAADRIQFNAGQSNVLDAVWNTVPSIQPIDGTPVFYRTILITDGAAADRSVVTREELFFRLQEESYPIDVVELRPSGQTEFNRDLLALSRISGGRHVGLNTEADVPYVLSGLSIGEFFWLRAVTPAALLDGSMRLVSISDGTGSLQFDVRVPAVGMPPVEAPPEHAQIPPAGAPLTLQPDSFDILAFLQDNIILVLIVAGAIGVVVVVIIVAATKKSKPKPVRPAGRPNVQNKTAILSDKRTVMLQEPGNSTNAGIRLYNMNVPGQTWNLDLAQGVVIGRERGCQVHIDNETVSRQQCRIYNNPAPIIENLSAANITQLNNIPINSPMPVKAGDKIKCGAVTLVVDLISGGASPGPANFQSNDPLNKKSELINV